jgi:hypothetical protein
MGAAARLAVEPRDLDHPDRPIGLGRGSDRATAQKPALRLREVGGHVHLPDRQVLADGVVDRWLERSHAVVVGPRQVEVDSRGAVLPDLGARDERPVEGLEGERVDDVQVGVELAHLPPERRLHRAQHRSFHHRRGVRQNVPDGDAFHRDPRDAHRAAAPAKDAAVGRLPATARVERRAAQPDHAGSRVEDGRLELEEIRRLVAE